MNSLFRKRIPLIICILLMAILIFSGCSFISLENKFMPNIDESKWKKEMIYQHFYNLNAPPNRFVYEYKNDDFKITIPSYYEKDKCSISIGPWLLPIIPTFPSCFFLEGKKDFKFQFIIQNFGDQLKINVKETKLINSKGQILTPKNVSYIAPKEKYRSLYEKSIYASTGWEKHWFYYPSTDMESYSTPVIIEKDGIVMFSLDYINIDRNEELKIELGKISSDRKSSILPTLMIRGGNIIVFCPVVFLGHEPCFITD